MSASPGHDLRAGLAEASIVPRRFTRGEHRAACPRCARTKPRRHDDALALRIDDRGAAWCCHRCGWTGGVRTTAERRRTVRATTRRPHKPPEPPRAPDPDPEIERMLARKLEVEAPAEAGREYRKRLK